MLIIALVSAYLEGVREHILKNLNRFKGIELTPGTVQMAPMPLGESSPDPFLPYRVNVFVDNSETQGPPIIVETNPSYHNLFGVVEKKPIVGGYVTDFTLIKAGSISRANGGYLGALRSRCLGQCWSLGSSAESDQKPRAQDRRAGGVFWLGTAARAKTGAYSNGYQSNRDWGPSSLSYPGDHGP